MITLCKINCWNSSNSNRYSIMIICIQTPCQAEMVAFCKSPPGKGSQAIRQAFARPLENPWLSSRISDGVGQYGAIFGTCGYMKLKPAWKSMKSFTNKKNRRFSKVSLYILFLETHIHAKQEAPDCLDYAWCMVRNVHCEARDNIPPYCAGSQACLMHKLDPNLSVEFFYQDP